MFQKLYGHLDNISNGLHKSHVDTQHTNAHMEAVSYKLTAIHEAINVQKKHGLLSYLQVMSFIALIITALYVINYMKHNTAAAVGQTQVQAPGTAYLEKQSDELNKKIALSEIHLQKLDSLINEQSQSLKELKTLNRMAVRTFRHIGQHMDEEKNGMVVGDLR